MAFLDNSGDIILDAVLTDLGRKRMAEGTFKITQFALGDDEIDYRIYNKNHPSGSAYYDLEILQTPVLEAFSSTNANINHGLVSFNGNLNILYMPTMKVWGKTNKHASVTTGHQIQKTSGSVFYVSVDTNTNTALQSAFTDDYGAAAGLYYQGGSHGTGILLETGIDSPSANPPRTRTLDNQKYYMGDVGLLDHSFDVSVNQELISAVNFLKDIDWRVETDGGTTLLIENPSTETTLGADTSGIANYATAIAKGKATKIRATETPSVADSFSMINGPSGMMCMLKFTPHTEVRDGSTKFTLFGRTGQDLFGDGNTYDYIDTMVYVSGRSSGVTAHFPIRLVKLVAT